MNKVDTNSVFNEGQIILKTIWF